MTTTTTNTIPLAECRDRINSGQSLTILDVRTPAEFDRIHAPGARLMPLDVLDPGAVNQLRRTADDPIYVICQSGGRASKACQQLQEAGLAQIFLIEGGMSAWEKMGLPVKRGTSKVISLERQVRISAGSLMLLGLLLAWKVHPYFLALCALVGAGLVFAGITDYCGMGMLLSKMPWNRRRAGDGQNCQK